MKITSNRFDDALSLYLGRQMQEIHTQMPAKVVAVDYGKGTVDVEILYEGVSPVDQLLNYKYPTIYDVPVHTYSAQGGTIKITVPIKAGDIGIVKFPEKPMDGFKGGKVSIDLEKNVDTHVLQGICFISELSTETTPVSIDPDNLIIQHNTTKITIKKGSVEAVTEQDFKINGAKVTPDGDFVTSDGISLRNVKQVYNNHTHGGGVTPSPQL